MCHPAGTSRPATSDGTGSPPARTTCQYKGQAHYWTVDGTDPPLPVWSYPEPLPEAASLAGLIGIRDDDPAVQLQISNAPARRKNPG